MTKKSDITLEKQMDDLIPPPKEIVKAALAVRQWLALNEIENMRFIGLDWVAENNNCITVKR